MHSESTSPSGASSLLWSYSFLIPTHTFFISCSLYPFLFPPCSPFFHIFLTTHRDKHRMTSFEILRSNRRRLFLRPILGQRFEGVCVLGVTSAVRECCECLCWLLILPSPPRAGSLKLGGRAIKKKMLSLRQIT